MDIETKKKVAFLAEAKRIHFSAIDAERAVLGILLKENWRFDDFFELAGKQGADIFYHARHRMIFDRMFEIYERGMRADVATVIPAVAASSVTLTESETRDYLVETALNAPPSERFGDYVRTLRDKAIERRFFDTLQSGVAGLVSSDVPSAKLASFDDELEQVRDLMSANENTERFIDEATRDFAKFFEERYEADSHLLGVSTGFDDLDKLTLGLQRQNVYVLAARPSMGKTSLALNIADHIAAKEKEKVHFFSLEMSSRSLASRIISFTSGLPMEKLILGKLHTEEAFERLTAGCAHNSHQNLLIDDAAGLTLSEIRSRARRAKRKFNTGVIMIDYLQIIASSNSRMNENERLTEISAGLKRLAKELDVAVVVLSQLSRDTEKAGADKRPTLSHLRGSGAIEQDADVIMFIYRDDYYNPDSEDKGMAEIIVRKNRQGKIGVAFVDFDAEQTVFRNRAAY